MTVYTDTWNDKEAVVIEIIPDGNGLEMNFRGESSGNILKRTTLNSQQMHDLAIDILKKRGATRISCEYS